jgi:hypothetical protein
MERQTLLIGAGVFILLAAIGFYAGFMTDTSVDREPLFSTVLNVSVQKF